MQNFSTKGTEDSSIQLLIDDKKELLSFARENIHSAVIGDSPPPVKKMSNEQLLKCGAFVTIKIKGKLRGCIGYIEATREMYETVADAARSAAIRDSRFSPISSKELKDISIEISLLSPFSPISPKEVIPGVHGLWIVNNFKRGLLLPQVAEERGWDRETFLDNVCIKAGLKPGDWKNKETELHSFTAVVFSDQDSDFKVDNST
ncbi:MAG: AmmeMemoRadiSam system protein A [Candidatus Electryonea clarkiae]|nr:AmmeMemoRadiSam system protein A [Candidatus Electryonea clarkiae]MDP8286030.1 AmmeMemoRadiSam system protein A [Candidatus Electryonea clarkiae]